MYEPCRTALVTAALLAVIAASASGDAAADARAFQVRLLAAVRSGSRADVAALFALPIRINVPGIGVPVLVPNRTMLDRLHDTLFTPQMLCALEHSDPSSADGVATLAGGRIVAERKGKAFKITRFTVVGQPVQGPKPRNVLFRWGTGETQFSGILSSGRVDEYVVQARRGMLLQASIGRFPGRALAIIVTNAATGERLAGSSSEFARTWAARIDRDGAYRIDVVHKGALCDPSVNYVLTIGLQL